MSRGSWERFVRSTFRSMSKSRPSSRRTTRGFSFPSPPRYPDRRRPVVSISKRWRSISRAVPSSSSGSSERRRAPSSRRTTTHISRRSTSSSASPRQCRPCAPARPRPLLDAGRTDQEDGHAAQRHRVRRLLGLMSMCPTATSSGLSPLNLNRMNDELGRLYASSRPPAGTSPNSSPTCRTSSARRSMP